MPNGDTGIRLGFRGRGMQGSIEAELPDAVPPFEVRSDHRGLLRPLEPLAAALGHPTGHGVVAVPAMPRRADALGTAIDLAAGLGWPLLVLCSHGLRPTDVRARVRRVASEGVHVVAATVRADDGLRGRRPWRCGEHSEARRRSDVDTNRKRNLALAAAAVTGLDWVLFVDDDVLELRTGDVLAALAHLRHRPDHDVVGWAAVQFPDNSVVHHARRDYLGRPQTCFVGGGALLVRLAGTMPPGFPPVYNEDWLFLFDALQDRAVAIGRDVRQLPKDVYGQLGRAASEEFGDVLAEGLYHLLHVGAPVETATKPRYWDDVRRKRERLLARIIEKLRELHASDPFDDHVVAALRALYGSRHELTRSTPESLAGFVERWREDLVTWDDAVGRLRKRETLVEALAYLGLHEAWIVSS